MQISPQLFADIVTTMRTAGTGAGHEKRRATRIELECKVQVSLMRSGVVAQTMACLTRDVSLTGVGFLATIPLRRADEIVIQLPRRHGDYVHMACQVMHCRAPADSLYIVGAEFTRIMTPGELGQLKDDTADELQRIQQSILI